MRACFLGQNICALGFGVATLQTPPLLLDEQTGKPVTAPIAENDEHVRLAEDKAGRLEPPLAGIGPL
ncbi:MAG TPA: hypothetical protein VGC16_04745 [Rhizomicrobium sp.]